MSRLKVTAAELIAKQQLEIQQLKIEASWHRGAVKDVHGIIYSIGGPLNDNRLGYTKEQMSDFYAIAKALDLT